MEIVLKDYRSLTFKLSSNNFKLFTEILEKYAFPEKNINFFNHAYLTYKNYLSFYKKSPDTIMNDWFIYDFDKEFKRQGIDFKNSFRILDNSDYSICSSYPKKLIVPLYMNNDLDLKKCACFRTKERIPTLTYRYKNGCCIWRSSQTKNGFTGKNEKDVLLLTKISESSKKLYVFDARPKLNAMANRLKGAGYECKGNYPNITMKVIFCGMANIHAVRDSYQKMFSYISYDINNENRVLTNLETTFWYEMIILLLKGSFDIYEKINQDCTVLIHCSDGWDRTSQLAATSQILLDKYYRTLDGFICLIEKDWLSFGHQFRYRSGMYSLVDTPSNVTNENQFCPIFIQWLDAIYQLMAQNYSLFEFNYNLLTFLACEIYTGKYGTFLFNSDKERDEFHAKEKTVSIWSYVKERKKDFLNPIYDPHSKKALSMNYKKVKLWTNYFYRFEKGNNGDYTELYTNLFVKKRNEYEKIIEKDKKIIEELSFFIQKNCKDISTLSPECQDFVNQSKCGTSFEILKITDSILNAK